MLRLRRPKPITAAAAAAAIVATSGAMCTTFYKNAMLTKARLQLALKDTLTATELQGNSFAFAEEVVCHSLDALGVLSLLKQHDLVWNSNLCDTAARNGKLQLLQWLHESGCHWDEQQVIDTAVMRGCVNMLKWLHEVTGPWSAKANDRMMLIAGFCNNLHVVKWLRTREVQWPKQLYGTATWDSISREVCWNPEVVRWALANGCTWGNWQCQLLTAERYVEHFSRETAIELFEWAHKNGCPCTCEAAAAAAAAAADTA
jgi:hypothetical protein